MSWWAEQQARAAVGAARLDALVRPASPASRRVSIGVLVLVAGGAAVAKSVLIAGDRWGLGAQLGSLALVAGTAGVVLARDAEPGARCDTVLRALGLRSLDRPGDDARARLAFALGPPAVVVVGTGVALLVTGRPNHATAGELADLLLLVALAEELVYRGAVLALARRALPPLPAEVVTGLAFVLCHAGNAGAPLLRFGGPALGAVAFSWLRHRTGSLAGPVGGHLATNLPGKVLGLG